MGSTLPRKQIGVVAAAFSGNHLDITLEHASPLKSFGSGRKTFSEALLAYVSRMSQGSRKLDESWPVLLLLWPTKPFGSLAAQ
jgi:hypothetical protein